MKKIIRRTLDGGYLLLMVALLMCSCSHQRATTLTYSNFTSWPLPADGGTFIIDISSAPYDEKSELSKHICDVPWTFYLVSNDEGKAKIYKDKLCAKTTWYKIWWQGEDLYLKLKPNKGEVRHALILFQADDIDGSYGFSLHQQGRQDH